MLFVIKALRADEDKLRGGTVVKQYIMYLGMSPLEHISWLPFILLGSATPHCNLTAERAVCVVKSVRLKSLKMFHECHF
jgi:hypothetical protein